MRKRLSATLLTLALIAAPVALGSVAVVVNGTGYNIPQTNEKGWGATVTSWMQAVSSSTLQKSGGSFTLSAETDFGATYGLKSAYLKGRGTNPASAGVVRLSNTDAISWRNAANSANLPLSVNGSDVLTFNGNPVVSGSALTGSRALKSDATGLITASSVTDTELGYVSGVTSSLCGRNQSCTLTNKTLSAASNTITGLTNSNLSGSAGITDANLSTISTAGKVANSATTATAANTASAIVARDGSGNFSAGTITANLTGNVTGNASGSAASFTGSLSGDVTGTQGSTTVATVGGKTASAVAQSVTDTVAATSANTVSTLVKRDASGNFAAGTITASGNVGVGTTAPGYKLDVSGTLNATGNATMGGTLGVTSDLAVNTNKFNVTASNGNTSVAGTLSVTGQSYMTGNVGIGTTAPGQKLSVSGDATASGYLNVGSNSAPASTTAGDLTATRLNIGNSSFGTSSVMKMTGTMTDTSAGAIAFSDMYPNISPASNSSTEFRINTTTANITGSADLTSNVFAAHSWVRMAGSGSVSSAMGTKSVGVVIPSAAQNFGTITNAQGAQFIGVTDGSTVTGTVTNAVGVRVSASSKNSNLTMTNQAGLLVDALSAATNNTSVLIGTGTIPSGNFGIYNASSNANYFAGNVGIGTTAPNQKLEINPSSGTAALRVAANSTTSYSEFTDAADQQLTINKTTASGAGSPKIDINPLPGDGSSVAAVRLFRATNTTGQKQFLIMAGNNSTTSVQEFYVSNSTGSAYVQNTYGATGAAIFKHANGSTTAPTKTLSGNSIADIQFRGYQETTSAFTGTVAQISAIAEEDFTSSASGAALSFRTVPKTSTTLSERMRIDNAGNVGIGTTAPGEKLEVSGSVKATGLKTTNLLVSSSAPTISSGFGTSPSVASNNGTAAFTINVGTGGTATSGVIGLPTASTGWNCFCTDVTTQSSTVFLCKQKASTTTTATIANYNTSATEAAWVASDIVRVSCFAY